MPYSSIDMGMFVGALQTKEPLEPEAAKPPVKFSVTYDPEFPNDCLDEAQAKKISETMVNSTMVESIVLIR